MKDKYYTPEIEEFYVGFEYEAYHNHDWFFLEGSAEWVSTKLSPDQPPYVVPSSILNTAINQGWVRVKYLDKEDIESLGFTHNHDVAGLNFIEKIFHSKNELWEIRFNTEIDDDLKRGNENTIGFLLDFTQVVIMKGTGLRQITEKAKALEHECVKYQGSIKNKSELKKVLKMIGYDFDN